jgi:hypothetical protein
MVITRGGIDLADSTPRDRVGTGLRAALMLAALTALWLMARVHQAFEKDSAENMRPSMLWLAVVGLGAAAGLAGGLASLPSWRGGYRWRRAMLIALPPLLLLAHHWLVLGLALPRGWNLPRLLLQFPWYMQQGPAFALSVMVGVGIASGFAHASAGGSRSGSLPHEAQ